MALDRESRANRFMNVVVAAGVLVVISGLAPAPIGGPGSYVSEWLKTGLPLLVVGLAVLAVRAPRYIRGKRR